MPNDDSLMNAEPPERGTPRRIQIVSPRDPRALARIQVNDIAVLLRGLTDIVRADPSAFEADDALKIRAFLVGQVEDAGETMVRLIGRDPGVASSFDFDMPLPTPQAPRERHPFTGGVTPRLNSRTPLAANSGDARPIGRLVGSKETVFGEPEAPPPPTKPSSSLPDGDVDDGGDGTGTGFLAD